MGEFSATVVRELLGSLVTADGQHMGLKLGLADGSEQTLAIPRSEILKLVELAALSQTQSDQVLGINPQERSAFSATWWELGFEKASKTAVLTLTLASGGKLSFQLPGNMPKAILEALQVHVDGATQEIAPGRKN